LVEKTIVLENVSLIDFLGVQNRNIKEVASAFPKSKIISRGNEIMIQGKTSEIIALYSCFFESCSVYWSIACWGCLPKSTAN